MRKPDSDQSNLPLVLNGVVPSNKDRRNRRLRVYYDAVVGSHVALLNCAFNGNYVLWVFNLYVSGATGGMR
jgi:hypothetical protein